MINAADRGDAKRPSGSPDKSRATFFRNSRASRLIIAGAHDRKGATKMAWMNYAHAYLTSKDEEGQGMVEYGLIIALVAVIAAVGLALVGEDVNALFAGLDFGVGS